MGNGISSAGISARESRPGWSGRHQIRSVQELAFRRATPEVEKMFMGQLQCSGSTTTGRCVRTWMPAASPAQREYRPRHTTLASQYLGSDLGLRTSCWASWRSMKFVGIYLNCAVISWPITQTARRPHYRPPGKFGAGMGKLMEARASSRRYNRKRPRRLPPFPADDDLQPSNDRRFG